MEVGACTSPARYGYLPTVCMAWLYVHIVTQLYVHIVTQLYVHMDVWAHGCSYTCAPESPALQCHDRQIDD